MKTMEKLDNIFIIFIHNEFYSKEKKKKKWRMRGETLKNWVAHLV
jgi:hypothetical protein